MKTAVVFWSGTGNTAAMADLVLAGMKEAGADAALIPAAGFKPDMIAQFDGIAFGCPAMGAEVLEEEEFQPMWDACKGSLAGKKIALFGSYGWGTGEWMQYWEDDCAASGVALCTKSVICNYEPTGNGPDACKALGKAVAA